MILKGSQRGSATQLARHLMNMRENEHVELHELRGFSCERLIDALSEAEAVAKGTRCKQFLFSLSLNPPPGEDVSIDTFETAIEMVEDRLGLTGLPRAIVFHEKEGRRHAHVVWSRIDPETMRARNLPFFKTRLMEVAKELYLHHEWEMPQGLVNNALRNPLNFTRIEWQQARRMQHDPRIIKAMFRAAWNASDSAATIKAALEERGFFLARGDRRGVVAMDVRGEVYSLSRWAGVKTKDVNARFPKPENLPSVEATRALIAMKMTEKLKGFIRDLETSHRTLSPSIEFRRTQMVQRQREERRAMKDTQAARWTAEENARAARLPRGFASIWSRITGKHRKIRLQNEMETLKAWQRDRGEEDALIRRQLEERRHLQQAIKHRRTEQTQEVGALQQEIAAYVQERRADLPKLDAFNEKAKNKAREKAPTKPREWQKPRGYDGPDFGM